MVFKLRKKEKNYAQVHVNMLRDKSLTLKAKGLGAVLEAYSDEFKVSLKSIEINSRDGKKALKSAIKELENGYYLFRFQTRDDQGLFVTYWAFDSERLEVEYLREIIAELEKVELITQSDILLPGYHNGTPVTGVPLSAPRSSAPRKCTPYKNNTDQNNLGKNTLYSPSLMEIKNFIEKNGYLVDASKFYDYYTAGNWRNKNGVEVKNWRQKLITWHRRENNHTSRPKISSPKRKNVWEQAVAAEKARIRELEVLNA